MVFVHINIANNYQPFKETTKAKNVMAIFGLLLKSIFLVALLVAVFIIGVMVYMYMRVKQWHATLRHKAKLPTGLRLADVRHLLAMVRHGAIHHQPTTAVQRAVQELQLTVRKHPTSMKNSTTSAPHNRQTARYSARTRATM